MTRRAAQTGIPEAPQDRRGAVRALSVRQIGRDLDEDVWDRVVALWRDPAGEGARSAEPAAAPALRNAIHDGTTVLVLVADGPRLLGFAAVDGDARTLRELHVRAHVPEGAVLTLLLQMALTVAQAHADSRRTASAAA